MDEYPPCSLDHCLPLAVVLGLPSKYAQESSLDSQYKDGATLIRSEPPPVEGDQVGALIQHIRDTDASGLPWNGRDTSNVKYKFRFRTTGRTYLLPPKLARLPDDFEIPPSQAVLHSPFSPLSPTANLYPDGLIDQSWLKKHQELVPSVLVCLYSLTADATLATLHDNKIKTDIGVLRNALAQSGCKSKLAVIVLVDNNHGVQERLENIRRGSGLDAKSFFAVPTDASPDELGRIMDNALTTLYAQSIEYYRDHGRRVKKKRGRGAAPQPTVPPTSGTSQTLSLPGWHVRYDFKSAVFAEYRQEMDVALRSFEQAYENLLSSEVLEIIPSWSPRWNQARFLADVIAVRCIRCLMWNDQHTAAVRRWESHRERIADFVDRQGHGTNNYGWEAWEARWAVVMANLIEKADIPDFDHSAEVAERIPSLQVGVKGIQSYFIKKQQQRLAAEVSLECAKELAAVRDWANVVKILRPFWDELSFRRDGWPEITEDMCWVLRAAAVDIAQADLVVSIDWELLNNRFKKHPKWHYDLTKSLDGVKAPRPSIDLNDELGTSFIVPSFVFRHEEGKAGLTCQAQLSITSNAVSGSAPIALESIILSDSEASSRGSVSLHVVSLAEATAEAEQETQASGDLGGQLHLSGTSDLTMIPGRTSVFEMNIPLREPGDASASSLKFTVNYDSFALTYTTNVQKAGTGHAWHTSIRVLPRPPKMEIREVEFLEQYYTNEVIELPFDIINEEDVDATVKLDVTVLSEDPPNLKLKFGDGEEKRALADGEECTLHGAPLGLIKSSESSRVILVLTGAERTAVYTLTLKASYSLVTDAATSIIQTATFRINVASPFEANYELLPRLHPDPWPSLFDHEGVQNPSSGIPGPSSGLAQAWCLVTRYASFASENLTVLDLDIEVQPAHGLQCQTSKRKTIPHDGLQVSPKTIEETQFDVAVKRASLDERNPTGLDVSFIIKWARPGAEPGASNRTLLAVPRLPVFNTEPRVLASVSYAKKGGQVEQIVLLDITIENASNHFLTFGLTMDPSEEFAFSGAKQTTLNLLPISRRTMTYRLIPLAAGGSWIRPTLTVKDKYFQKVLRIIPTDSMKADKDGVLIWVPPVAEDGDEH
ncbi:hypothetical protein UCDDA912_g05416 [Diaporthe ampelina]|uniref:Trafficking protein particle complex subunit 11 n=1 Tax=Diaporthe ampelina TaxID=1214573 RepID=A0A0G2I3U0_9PEZI|nr:hypothetical protein UCDDA912_g05416 [Diaporthe ampelina]